MVFIDKLNIKRHIILNFLFRIISIFFSFIVVTLSLKYLGNNVYGLWATILSILTWINYFDIGIGNGLRNSLTESISKKLHKESKELISTGYFCITIISTLIILIMGFLFFLINWPHFFNIKFLSNENLLIVMLVNLIFVATTFILKIISSIYYAFQKSSIVGLIQLVNQFLIFFGIILLINCSAFQNKLAAISFLYGFCGIISNLLFTIIFFIRNTVLRPSIKNIKKDKVRVISSLGLRFFIVQIAALIIFTTDNILITKLFGTTQVTPYDVTFKVFSIIPFIHGIIITPMWSAVTKAYTEGNILIIKKWLRRLKLLQLLIVLATIILALMFPYILKIWLNKSVEVPNELIWGFGLYVVISTWNNIFAYIFNGIGEVNYQLILSVIAGIINIPLSIYLAINLNLGVVGVILATNISLSLGALTYNFKMNALLKQKRKELRLNRVSKNSIL